MSLKDIYKHSPFLALLDVLANIVALSLLGCAIFVWAVIIGG